MAGRDEPKKPVGSRDEGRVQRLAAELRANLKKRKARARTRAGEDHSGPVRNGQVRKPGEKDGT